MSSHNPFDFFGAIYCLTTDERNEKYESALKEFESIGIADRIIKFNGTEIDKKYWGSNPKEQKISRALASASHLEIWKIAEKNELSNVLIFEDDVSFTDWNNAALTAAIHDLVKIDWELFYLGYNLFGDATHYTEIATHLIGLHTGTDIRSTHAYCLNRSAYKKIMGYNPFQSKMVDQWLPGQLKIHCLVPLMTVQNQTIKGRKKKEMFLDNFRKIREMNKTNR